MSRLKAVHVDAARAELRKRVIFLAQMLDNTRFALREDIDPFDALRNLNKGLSVCLRGVTNFLDEYRRS